MDSMKRFVAFIGYLFVTKVYTSYFRGLILSYVASIRCTCSTHRDIESQQMILLKGSEYMIQKRFYHHLRIIQMLQTSPEIDLDQFL